MAGEAFVRMAAVEMFVARAVKVLLATVSVVLVVTMVIRVSVGTVAVRQ